MQAEDRRLIERTPPPGDQFVVVELPSGEERLEPLVDLSANGIAILLRARRPEVQPGMSLPRLRLFTNGECTLESRVNVREITQVTLGDGGVAWKVGLRLEYADLPGASKGGVDEYDSPQIIADTVLNLLTAKAGASLTTAESEDGVTATFLGASDDRQLVTLSISGKTQRLPKPGHACHVTAELYGSRVALKTIFIGHKRNRVQIAWPNKLIVWRQRISSRVKSVSEKLTVEFEAPFTRAKRSRPLVDVSPSGVAFATDSSDGLLVGVLLTGLVIKLDNGSVTGRGIVRNVRHVPDGRLIAGVELIGLPERSQKLLGDFVTQNVHPQVRIATARDVPRLWSVYAAAGLFQRERVALSPIIGRIETTRKVLLGRGKELFVQTVATGEGELQGTAELLRTYDTTWTLQHVGQLGSSHLTADQLIVPLIEKVASRKDCRTLHALLGPDLQSGGQERLRAMPPTDDHLVWREYVLLTEGPTYVPPASLATDVQNANASDIDWIIQKLRDRLKPIELKALDLTAGQMHLDNVEHSYHSAGLQRRRMVRLALSVGGPLGFALVEQSSPGLNFLGLGNLVRLFSTDQAKGPRQAALIALAHDAVLEQRDHGRKRTLLLVDPTDVPVLEGVGFVQLGPMVEIVADKMAASQIVNFVSLLI